jgi:GxxExxY protein
VVLNHKDTKNTKYVNEEEREGLAHEVIGAAIEVHRFLGPGYLETIYEEALSLELAIRNIPFARQVTFTIMYKEQAIGESRLDLLIGGRLIVELKAVDAFAPIHTAQALSYLKATGHRLALLINFNVPVLKEGITRVVR